MKRSSGILLHISSLPSPYGIGNLGRCAREFVDFLHAAGQRYWQILPLSPTGYGDSPYQSASSYGGNPYFIDPEELLEQGLLTREELQGSWGENAASTDYGRIYERRLPLLRRAFQRTNRQEPAFLEFCGKEACWLEEHSLFMALKAHFGGAPWLQWETDLRLHHPAALKRWRKTLEEEITFQKWLQFVFFRQWDRLHAYASSKEVSIIGDIPIYVPMDSVDVWSSPEYFQLTRNRTPRVVAGCPPDGFSKDGQYWGNPIYDWEKMAKDGYRWWVRRVGAAARFFDVIRIDHFRGIESYWSIPAAHKTARHGKWVKGPGMELIRAIRQAYPHAGLIAEDLGFLTPEVRQLLEDSGLPGMKVLEFAFDSGEYNDYLPHRYSTDHCICYTGTHDNHTLRQWTEELSPETRSFTEKYMNLQPGEDFCESLLRLGMSSRAELFIAQMQDWLGLDGSARMNEPGVRKPQNWCWRMLPDAADKKLAAHIYSITKEFDRI